MIVRVANAHTISMVFICVGLVLGHSSVVVLGSDEELARAEYFRSSAYGRTLLKDGGQEAFVPVEYEDLPSAVRVATESKLQNRLQPSANPRNAKSFSVRVRAAGGQGEDDLIEYRWRFAEHDLRLVESVNAVELQLDLEQLATNERLRRGSRSELARVKSLVGDIIRQEGRDDHGSEFTLEMPWKDMLVDGLTFSTNPGTRILNIQSWHNRIDISVDDGTLRILMYHNIRQIPGFQNGSKWLPEDFRDVILRQAREASRLPSAEQDSGG